MPWAYSRFSIPQFHARSIYIVINSTTEKTIPQQKKTIPQQKNNSTTGKKQFHNRKNIDSSRGEREDSRCLFRTRVKRIFFYRFHITVQFQSQSSSPVSELIQFCGVMSESVNSMPRVYFPGSVIINPTPRKHSGLVYIRQFQSSRKRWLQIPYTVKSHFTRFRTALSNSTPHNCV